MLEDILDDDLKQEQARIIVNDVFDGFVRPSGTPSKKANAFTAPATLKEFFALVQSSIRDMEARASTPEIEQVTFTEEEPDTAAGTETIVYSMIERKPGQFAQGKPMSREHTNQRPMIRESFDDPVNPGYKCVVYGYYYDNIVRFTCWARTNKVANDRATWFEDLMEEYSWIYKLQGLDRVLFWGRNTDLVKKIDGTPWYGRPMDFFVRTEKLRIYQQKKLEEMVINVSVNI